MGDVLVEVNDECVSRLPAKKGKVLGMVFLSDISGIILVYYCKCCSLIGYSTCYLFIIR